MARRHSRLRGFCPCCGFRTLSRGERGSYDACDICAWTDDPEQFESVTVTRGENPDALVDAWQNVRRFGWAGHGQRPEDLRDPTVRDQRDPEWPYREIQ
ncbi:CPCC family cysteine-rich protein [Haloprofundus sp. MHR1]|uniref:CPCC family cysteine-rich protein n=1 Tax=Haloprofundus sp. MHR1 TaxID=2572921 RepID=UPI0010BF395D|nr:CPCC family cysteine-rich protein [Haloprofundus sp. MHR1]QCJ45698.1 hypothetical protein FCF25_00545 [Haloprofundus sp. MHR1]